MTISYKNAKKSHVVIPAGNVRRQSFHTPSSSPYLKGVEEGHLPGPNDEIRGFGFMLPEA
jgi:hypothetical protein